MKSSANKPERLEYRRLRLAASQAVTATVAAGRELYVRARHLPRLIPIAEAELNDPAGTTRGAILRRLARALRAERNRGRAGHWSYDLNRHVALRQAYAAERELAGVREANPRPPRDGAGPARVAP